MSLGDTRAGVLRRVLRDGVKLAAPGMLLGAVGGLALARLLLDPMFATIRLPVADSRIILLAAIAALGVVLIASLSPARRAASVDPMRAMRAE
jgi:putative ABC transport system permease protein